MEQEYQKLLEQLANREIKEFRIPKAQFLDFRPILIQREDFKHFRGIAQHKGDVVYQYLDEARS